MAKRPSIEDQLARLKNLRSVASTPEAQKELRSALEDKNYLLVARGAEVIAGAASQGIALAELIPDLEKAFDRLIGGQITDRGCAALTAVAEAMHALEARSQGQFLRGIRHVHKEGSFGAPADAAVRLRGVCAMALVQMGYRHVLHELADLLADPEPGARAAAALALAATGREEAGALLRLKSRTKDEPEVIAECLVALTRLRSHGWLAFVGSFLHHGDDHVRGSAALAIGETHTPEGFRLLRERWESTLDAELRKELLLPMVMCRTSDALEFVLAVVEKSPAKLAAAAVEALRLYRTDAAVRERVQKAVESRDDRELTRAFAKAFN